jgi:branched-chain amino acid transport system substrate-binding protein
MKKYFPIVLSILLVIGLILSGCGTSTPSTSAPPTGSSPATAPAGAAPTEIRVGVPAAQTGNAAGFGKGGVFGIQAAVDDINKGGGILLSQYGVKVPVKLIVVDNGSDPQKGGDLAETLILQQKVDFLLSVGPSDFNPPMATVAERNKVPFLGGPGPFEAWKSNKDSGNWQYSWACSFAIATPAPTGDFRADKPGYTLFNAWEGALKSFGDQTNKKIALFASDDPDGRAWYQAFAPQASTINFVTYKSDQQFGLVPTETTDFSTLINEFKANDCQLLWSNAPGPFFGSFWKQANALGYLPKQVFATRSGLFYSDVKAWGGNLANGVCNEMFWHPSMVGVKGIGDTTAQSLDERWRTATGEPTNQCVGWLYTSAQVLADSIQRAGTLDHAKINDAISKTDLLTIDGRVVFDVDHYSRIPVAFGQWQKTDKPYVWENAVVFSENEYLKKNADLIFPIPYGQ